MISQAAPRADDASTGGAPALRRAGSIAAMILLAVAAARAFAPELAFRVSEIRVVRGGPEEAPVLQSTGPHAGDPSRMVFAVVLLGAWAVWLTGQAASGRLRLYRPGLAALMGLFAVLSLLSVFGASDQRAGWSSWIEQVSLLAACLLAAQVFRGRGATRLAISVLAAVAIALAIKGFWQVLVEFPANAEYLREHGLEAIRDTGHDPTDPTAGMLRKRILGTTPFGYYQLANPFASLLLVGCFAATALAAVKLKAAGVHRRQSKLARGEVHLPTLAGLLTALGALSAVVVLAMTRTRGAIASAVLVFGAGLLVWHFRAMLARRWRLYMAALGGMLLAGIIAVAAWGLTHDSLPTRTMTFRWYYWTASSRIVQERPLLGTGPGNFASAYLRHRRVEGEEQIKAPHNVAVHALTQYGLPGGLCYLAALLWVLAAAMRPGESELGDLPPPSPGQSRNAAAAVVVAVLLTRIAFTGGTSAALLVLDAVAPAAVMALCLALAIWRGGLPAGPGPAAGLLRAALVAGVTGFALHNLVTFSLWMPGPATTFWVAAGVCLAAAPGGRRLESRAIRWPAALACIAAVAVAALLLGGPAMARYSVARDLTRRIEAGDTAGAARLAPALAAADPLDPRSAEDAAKMLAHAASLHPPSPRRRELAERAVAMAREAIKRDPAGYTGHRLAADIRWHTAPPGSPERQQALEHMAEAVRRDPVDARMRVDYARMLLAEGRRQACLDQLDAALRIDAGLPREGRPQGSPVQLTPEELEEIRALRAEAESSEP